MTWPASGRETEAPADTVVAAHAATAAIGDTAMMFLLSRLSDRRCSTRTSRRTGGIWEPLMLPRILNYLIAIYLIFIGLIGLFPHLMTHVPH